MRGYVRLPPDDELIALLQRHGWVQEDVARDLGCSPSAVGKRVQGIRLRHPDLVPARPRPGAPRIPQVSRIAVLENLVAELTARIEALEANPGRGGERIIEWKPNHRRVSDGGLNTNRQFRAFRRSQARRRAAKAAKAS